MYKIEIENMDLEQIAIRTAYAAEKRMLFSLFIKINDVKSTRGKKTLGIFSPTLKRKNKDNKKYMK